MSNRRRVRPAGWGLLAVWLLTGGCVRVESEWRYVKDYNRDYRPWLLVDVARNERTRGVLYLFTVEAQEPPFDAGFTYYTQDLADGAELVVDRLAVRYPDGTEADLTREVPGRLPAEPFEMSYVEDHIQMRRQALRATWQVRDCVTQKGPFTVQISGHLRKGERVLERFDASLGCTPFRETELHTRWGWWLRLWAGASC